MTTRRLKLFFNFEKEEAWLNRSAARGLLPRKGLVFYQLEPIPPGSAVVRVDYRSAMSRRDFADYVTLFADAGWRHLSGSRHGGAQYFASSSANPNTDIFSCADSKAQRYRRSIVTLGILLLPYLSIIYSVRTSFSSSPREWYYTPGLWDMHGKEFVGHFLFETPFVLLRVGLPLFASAFCVFLIAVVAYQYSLFRRTKLL